MAKKYIEQEAAIKAVEKNDCEGHATWAIRSVPVADVVEVVRCKDCRMANSCSDDRDMYCTLNHCYKGKNCFCADGKKREEYDVDTD